MQIKLSNIDFDVVQVPGNVRAAVLADPIIAQVVWRDVYKWDHTKDAGQVLVKTSEKGGVPLPNGMVFFVGSPSEPAAKDDSRSRTMAKRVLEGIGAKAPSDIMGAMHKILHMPQKLLPLEAWEPLNKAASYVVKMHTEFNVVELKSASRNMAFYVVIPGQVAFHHEITAKDDAAYDALDYEAPQTAYVIPPHSRANQTIRTLALAQRIKEMQEELTARAAAGEKLDGDAVQRAFTMTVGEWRLLTQGQKAA